MKKLLLLTSIVFASLILSMGFALAASNKIDNPGFEDGFDGWEKSCWWHDSCDQEIDSTGHESAHSVKLTAYGVQPGKNFAASSVYTDYELKLDKNSEYKLSAWVYMNENADVDQQLPRMMIVLYETRDDWITNVYASNPSLTEPHSKVFTNVQADQMTQIEIEFEVDDYRYARVWLIAEAHDGCGDQLAEVWFDDVVLEKISGGDDDDDDGDELVLRGEYLFGDGCVSDWQCSGWSACTEGGRTRQCYDRNACELPSSPKPSEAIGCIEEISEPVLVEPDKPNYLLWMLIAIAVILILVLIFVAMRG